MQIIKVFLADIHDPEDPRWDLTMYVVFCNRDEASDICEDIPDINRRLEPYGICDDDVHYYFDKEDLGKIKNSKIIDSNNYEITFIEEIKPEGEDIE